MDAEIARYPQSHFYFSGQFSVSVVRKLAPCKVLQGILCVVSLLMVFITYLNTLSRYVFVLINVHTNNSFVSRNSQVFALIIDLVPVEDLRDQFIIFLIQQEQ